MNFNNIKLLAATGILVLCSFVGLVTVALPSDNLTYSSLQNFGHFALFAVLGFLVLRLLCELMRPHLIKASLISAVVLVALGFAVEWFQSGMTSRTASVSDFALDIAGIIIGFLAYWSVRLWRAGKVVIALLIVACVAIGSFVAFRPSLPLVGFDLLRPPLPVVREFNHPFSSSKLMTTGAASYDRVAIELPTGTNSQALRVTFFPGKFSGIVFHESPLKWSDYAGIRLDIFNPMPSTRQIELRINDRLHNNQYEDRYNGSFTIVPGFNEIQVSLGSLEQMGKPELSGRKLNIDDISQIQLFSNESDTAFALDIVQIKLF